MATKVPLVCVENSPSEGVSEFVRQIRKWAKMTFIGSLKPETYWTRVRVSMQNLWYWIDHMATGACPANEVRGWTNLSEKILNSAEFPIEYNRDFITFTLKATDKEIAAMARLLCNL